MMLFRSSPRFQSQVMPWADSGEGGTPRGGPPPKSRIFSGLRFFALRRIVILQGLQANSSFQTSYDRVWTE